MALFDFRKTGTESVPPPAPPRPGSSAPRVVPLNSSKIPPMEDLLRLVVDEGASDLHLTVGSAPAVRLNGRLVKLTLPPLSAEDTETLARAVTSEASKAKVTVSAKGRNSWLTRPPTKPIGRKTSTVVRVEEVIARATSLGPLMDAVRRSSPLALCL